jgi:hypothetical protein
MIDFQAKVIPLIPEEEIQKLKDRLLIEEFYINVKPVLPEGGIPMGLLPSGKSFPSVTNVSFENYFQGFTQQEALDYILTKLDSIKKKEEVYNGGRTIV